MQDEDLNRRGGTPGHTTSNCTILFLGVEHELHGDDCGYPGLPAGAILHLAGETEQYPAGAEAQYSCEDGRIRTGADTSRRCGQNGTWSGSLPLCRENLALHQPSLQSGTLLNYASSMAVDGGDDSMLI